ncbi:MAG TPA: hypothetical protein VGN81_30080 [Pseudonocardiaceae bacterium]|jgi:hypothetical protein
MLEPEHDIEQIPVALAVDLPGDEVAWRTEPLGAEHWANATRLSRNPFVVRWRSVHAPVWNHEIERPVLFWDAENGVDEGALDGVRAGAPVRPIEPSDDEFVRRMSTELATSLAEVRRCTEMYTDKRWKPGKLTPTADALWLASTGYLDLLDAVTSE